MWPYYRTPMTNPKSKDRRTPESRPAPARGAVSRRAKPEKGRPYCIYSPAEVHEIFRRFAVQRPEPKGELEYVNPFTLLVAVVLSAQATDAGVNKATRALFKVADTPQKMAALGEERDRKSTRLNSSHVKNSYAVFCLKK